MKRLLILSILIILLSACSKDLSNSTEHFNVYGLGLGASIDEVTSELGIPDEKQVYNEADNEKYVIYSYPRLFLGFKEDKLVFISSDDPEFSTEKGIRIKDDKRKVLSKYKNLNIFCSECGNKTQSVTDLENLPEFYYVEDDDIRLVFGGEGSKVEFMQIGQNLPKDMMFAHSINPKEDNKMTSKEMEKNFAKIEKENLNKLVKQYANYLKVSKVKFTEEMLNKNVKEMVSKGKLPGLDFSIGSSYRQVIDTLGAPDRSGVLGEGSYNLIYGDYNLAFNYQDLFDKNKNPDTKVLTIAQSVDEPIVAAIIMEKLGDPDDYYVEEYDGIGYLRYKKGEYELSFITEGADTVDASIHDDDVVSLELYKNSNESSNNDVNARYDFQVTGTDGKEYQLFIFSEDEEARSINADDVWFTEWIGAPIYSGEYFASLKKEGSLEVKKQEVSLGNNTFVTQDETSTASMIYAEDGPDVLLITQKDGASFTSYKTYVVKNGELKEISFIYEGEKIEDLYLTGFRNVTSKTWESLMFSNSADAQWLVTAWELDLKAEAFRSIKDTKHSIKPW